MTFQKQENTLGVVLSMPIELLAHQSAGNAAWMPSSEEKMHLQGHPRDSSRATQVNPKRAHTYVNTSDKSLNKLSRQGRNIYIYILCFILWCAYQMICRGTSLARDRSRIAPGSKRRSYCYTRDLRPRDLGSLRTYSTNCIWLDVGDGLGQGGEFGRSPRHDESMTQCMCKFACQDAAVWGVQ